MQPPSPPTVADLVRQGSFSEEARALATSSSTLPQYVQALQQGQLHADALQVLCHWLPPREGTWWGCLCLWHVLRPDLPGAETAAVRAVVHWLQKPSADRLQAVAAAASAAGGHDSSVGRLAFAAAATAERYRAARILLSALLLAAVQAQQETAVIRQQFLQLGLEVARGQNRF